jgi:hypothetical protein
VHVGGLAEDDAVEADPGDGVEPVEDQVDAVPVGRLVREGGPVDPVVAADPGEAALGVVDVRVADQAGGQQVAHDLAGHRRRDRIDPHRRSGVTGDGPAFVQGSLGAQEDS